MRRLPKLKRGNRLLITWWDIVSDAVGDVKDAEPALCITLGFFWEYKGRGRSRSMVTALTLFPNENNEPRGWDVYPVGCIEKIEVLYTGSESAVVYKRPEDEEIKPAEVQTIRSKIRP